MTRRKQNAGQQRETNSIIKHDDSTKLTRTKEINSVHYSATDSVARLNHDSTTNPAE